MVRACVVVVVRGDGQRGESDEERAGQDTVCTRTVGRWGGSCVLRRSSGRMRGGSWVVGEVVGL